MRMYGTHRDIKKPKPNMNPTRHMHRIPNFHHKPQTETMEAQIRRALQQRSALPPRVTEHDENPFPSQQSPGDVVSNRGRTLRRRQGFR